MSINTDQTNTITLTLKEKSVKRIIKILTQKAKEKEEDIHTFLDTQLDSQIIQHESEEAYQLRLDAEQLTCALYTRENKQQTNTTEQPQIENKNMSLISNALALYKSIAAIGKQKDLIPLITRAQQQINQLRATDNQDTQ